MNAKISAFVVRVEAIIYLILHNLHDCTFKRKSYFFKRKSYDIKRKYYDIRQVSLIFSKESHKVPIAYHRLYSLIMQMLF